MAWETNAAQFTDAYTVDDGVLLRVGGIAGNWLCLKLHRRCVVNLLDGELAGLDVIVHASRVNMCEVTSIEHAVK